MLCIPKPETVNLNPKPYFTLSPKPYTLNLSSSGTPRKRKSWPRTPKKESEQLSFYIHACWGLGKPYARKEALEARCQEKPLANFVGLGRAVWLSRGFQCWNAWPSNHTGVSVQKFRVCILVTPRISKLGPHDYNMICLGSSFGGFGVTRIPMLVKLLLERAQHATGAYHHNSCYRGYLCPRLYSDLGGLSRFRGMYKFRVIV